MTVVTDNYQERPHGRSPTLAVKPFGQEAPMPLLGHPISETTCLPYGCYTLTVNDSYGDGICCAYGQGSFVDIWRQCPRLGRNSARQPLRNSAWIRRPCQGARTRRPSTTTHRPQKKMALALTALQVARMPRHATSTVPPMWTTALAPSQCSTTTAPASAIWTAMGTGVRPA